MWTCKQLLISSSPPLYWSQCFEEKIASTSQDVQMILLPQLDKWGGFQPHNSHTLPNKQSLACHSENSSHGHTIDSHRTIGTAYVVELPMHALKPIMVDSQISS
jgi:hypothetical protein